MGASAAATAAWIAARAAADSTASGWLWVAAGAEVAGALAGARAAGAGALAGAGAGSLAFQAELCFFIACLQVASFRTSFACGSEVAKQKQQQEHEIQEGRHLSRFPILKPNWLSPATLHGSQHENI